jgi:hypothetical protein
MRIRGLKLGLALSCGLLAVPLQAVNLTNHGGGVIVSAKVVLIFWGPSFNNAASPDFAYARTLQAYRDQLGSTTHYAILQEYGVHPSDLGAGTPDWFDISTPPVNVTDANVQAEVNRYLATHAFDNSTVYEVVIPRTSYSSSGTSTSCGGPSLAYCAYHSHYSAASGTVKYSIQPYASCTGCKFSVWTDVQNQERLVFHETCDAVTNPVNGWYDSSGNQIADKCTWSPMPFLDGGYAYQYLWSNKRAACVR